MKNKVVTILIIIAVLALAGVAIFTALRLFAARREAVAPTAPESKPKAAEGVELVENTDPRILYTGSADPDETGLQVGVTYTGNWEEVTFAGASGGTVHEVASRQTDMAGIKLVFTFSGSGPIVFNYRTYVSTAWDASNCPGCGVAYHGGEAEVWVDGENKGNVTFYEPVAGAAQLKNRTYFVSSSGTHTIEIKKVWVPTVRTDVPQRISLDSFYVYGVTEPSPTPTVTPVATPSPTPSQCTLSFTISEATPTSSATPTPTATTKATATPTATPKATVTPTPTATPAPQLPDAGVSTPTLLGLGIGTIILIFSLVLAL